MLGNINSETMRATNLQVIFDYLSLIHISEPTRH